MLPHVALEYRTATASVAEIEQLGILKATFLAMKRAVDGLKVSFDWIGIDGSMKNPLIQTPQMNFVKGDMRVYAIAAASILAKTARDSYMIQQSEKYAGYEFEKNMGYGTAYHLAALRDRGVTSLHRKNFQPISKFL